jgi:hypothetical protein
MVLVRRPDVRRPDAARGGLTEAETELIVRAR